MKKVEFSMLLFVTWFAPAAYKETQTVYWVIYCVLLGLFLLSSYVEYLKAKLGRLKGEQ